MPLPTTAPSEPVLPWSAGAGAAWGRPPWRAILRRIWRALNEDRLLLIAAGVTFFALLALFPALAAFVSLYGLLFDPSSIARHAAVLEGLVPGPVTDVVSAQLDRLARQPGEALTLSFVMSLLLSVWSASGGVKSMIEALNVAFACHETRSFLRLNLLALALTLGAMALALLLALALAVLPALLAVLDLGTLGDLAARMLRWPILAGAVGLALAALYRFGPDRRPRPWRCVTWGSALATLVWLIASVAFSVYLERVVPMDATYGALGTPIAFLLWLWISVIVVVVGAEVDAAMERPQAP